MTPSSADDRPTHSRRPDMSREDFEEFAGRAPRAVRLDFVDGRLSAAHEPMDVDDFEELAQVAPEGVTLELINGRLRVKPMPDHLHGAIIMWLLRQCILHRPALALYPEQGLAIKSYRQGRAKADGALAPLDHFIGQPGEWGDPKGVLMVVEVTSYDSDTHHRDRVEKRDGYAASGIPVYLLIDRDTDTLVVFSDPRDGAYRQRAAYPFGASVPLPGPVDITLDTERLKEYTR